jgi:hypothetical protein
MEVLARQKALRDASVQSGTPACPMPASSPEDQELMPVEAYLSTGRTPPRGTPRQTRWAVDIKTKLWPGLAPLLKSRCFRISDLSYYRLSAHLVGIISEFPLS